MFIYFYLIHIRSGNTRLKSYHRFLRNKTKQLIRTTKLKYAKLGLWEQQLRTKNFTHFPTLPLQSDVTQEATDKYSSLISDLNLEFENRFQDF